MLRTHNLTVLLATLLSLLAAVGVWVLLYYLGLGAILAFRTLIYGEAAQPPENYFLWFAIALCLTLAGAMLWRLVHRPGRLYDRPILGWHVIPEILLLPASLILSVTDNLSAYRKENPSRLAASWYLLCELLTNGKIARRHLPQLGIEQKLLEDALLDLQLLGLVDLHEGRGEWFYRIRGPEEDRIRSWRSSET